MVPGQQDQKNCMCCGKAIDWRALICPYCGADYRPYQRPAAVTGAREQLEAQVSVATNTRRIALVLILAVFLTVGTTLVTLAISVFYPGNVQGARSVLSTWIVLAVSVMLGGFYVILSDWRSMSW